ncbi:MAG: prolipoprotein diacylglyceryl transferase [Culicoidibacterales bacterium]
MFTPLGIKLGPLTIHWYAIIILSGALLALYLAQQEVKKRGVNPEIMFDLFFVIMGCGIIGARIYYVIFQWEYYIKDIWKIFAVYEGGIAIYGAIIGGSIGCYFYCKKKGYNIILVLDIVFPLVLMAQSIGRWGNFVNVEAYGTAVPGSTAAEQIAYLQQFFIPNFIIEKMNINGVYHHPTFLYESLWSLTGFILIYFFIRKIDQIKLGAITCSYLVWYGIGRFMVEGMRTDSLYLYQDIRISQIVSIIIVFGGAAGLVYFYANAKTQINYKDAIFIKKARQN